MAQSLILSVGDGWSIRGNGRGRTRATRGFRPGNDSQTRKNREGPSERGSGAVTGDPRDPETLAAAKGRGCKLQISSWLCSTVAKRPPRRNEKCVHNWVKIIGSMGKLNIS